MPTMILITVDCPWGLVGHLVLGPHIISRGRRFVEADDERVHKPENLARRDVAPTEVYQPAAGSLNADQPVPDLSG